MAITVYRSRFADLETADERVETLSRTELVAKPKNERGADSNLPDSGMKRCSRRRKGAISDLRFFCNSIDRAVDLARRAGVEIEVDRREYDGVMEMQIRVVKSQNQKLPS
jgi:hypothetical protein